MSDSGLSNTLGGLVLLPLYYRKKVREYGHSCGQVSCFGDACKLVADERLDCARSASISSRLSFVRQDVMASQHTVPSDGLTKRNPGVLCRVSMRAGRYRMIFVAL